MGPGFPGCVGSGSLGLRSGPPASLGRERGWVAAVCGLPVEPARFDAPGVASPFSRQQVSWEAWESFVFTGQGALALSSSKRGRI